MKQSARYSILIVEDDPTSQKLIETMLTKVGHKVVTVKNGIEALKLFEEQFFPIIVTDWVMPEMDGLELSRAIRKISEERYVFIILLTAKDAKKDIIKGFEAGVDDYLTKPLHPGELLARLNSGIRILNLEQSLKVANEEIKHLSITDGLTDCYNRSYLADRLPQEIKRAKRYERPLSVIMSDIDYFKQVNDSFGHMAGDRVLVLFSESIKSNIRLGVDWVARYGGEEFLIVLPETDLQGAAVAAEKFRNIINEKVIQVANKKINVTASFGVSGCNSKDDYNTLSVDKLISAADEYLYKAKKEGRNRVVVGSIS